jgi:hypothetical protein
MKENIDELVTKVTKSTNNFTKILSIDEIKDNGLYWGGNGVGDRWANKEFNYSVIYSNKNPKSYSENGDEIIPKEVIEEFLQTNNNKGVGIIGIFVHSKRTDKQQIERPINKNIQKDITKLYCVVCGTHDTVCDHKNDLYNDIRVLSLKTQLISDFQPLCNHCNLQKRQICKKEKQTEKLYSAKNIPRYKVYPFEFPWEKKHLIKMI